MIYSLRQVLMSLRGGVSVLFVLALAACATNPATGKREFSLMSEAQEIQIGQQQDAGIKREMGVYEDRALQQYVSDLGLKLAGRVRAAQFALALYDRRRGGRQRVRAAGRVHLPHARHHAVSGRRSADRWRSWPRDRPRDRTPLRQAILASDRRLGGDDSRQYFRARSRSVRTARRERARSVVSEEQPRRRGAGRRAGGSIRHARRLGSGWGSADAHDARADR